MPPTRRVSAGVTTNGKEITMDARLSYHGNALFAKFPSSPSPTPTTAWTSSPGSPVVTTSPGSGD